MGKAKIPIVSIPRNKPYKVDLTVEDTDIPLFSDNPGFLKSVHIQGTVSSMQQEYLFQGTLNATFQSTCDRCLEPASAESSVVVGWIYEPGTPKDVMEEFAASDDAEYDDAFNDTEEAEEVKYYDGVTIDLTSAIAEEILLVIPNKIYCTEKCNGLCPQCGINLNASTCNCTPEPELDETNSGFAGLKDMFPDLPTESSEE